jgi:hypothetical protein
VQRAGWTQTTPNPAPIAARSGQDVAGVNVGLFNRTVAITVNVTSAVAPQPVADGGGAASSVWILGGDATKSPKRKRLPDLLV